MSTKPLRILCAFNEHSVTHEWLPTGNPTFDLKELGHSVVLVHSCSWLRKKLQESMQPKYNPFDVVLADYYLPEKRGDLLYLPTTNLRYLAKKADVKCCGIFAPDYKSVAPEFQFHSDLPSLFMVSERFRKPDQERDVAGMLEFLLTNWNAAVEFDDESIATLLSGLDEVDTTGY